MEGIINSPTFIVFILGLTASAMIAFPYIFSRIRKQDIMILRNANKDLRETIEDNDKRIASLEKQVDLLSSKVDILEKHNKTLEDLVVTALKQYFFENPKVASSFKDIITSTPIDNT